VNDEAKTKVILNVFQMFLTFVRELLLDAQNDNPLETPEQLQEFLDWLVTTLRILPDKGPTLRKEPRSRKVDKCGTVLPNGALDIAICQNVWVFR